jgi:hypothetical protein
MRIVDKPAFTPFRCAAVPFIGQTHPDTRWIDCAVELDREHVYLSDHAVRKAMRCLGWATPEEHGALQRQTAELASRVVELEEQLTEASRELDAVYILKSKNWSPAKKPGRPKKEHEAA